MGISRRGFLAKSGMTTLAVAMRRGLTYAMSNAVQPHYRTQFNVSSLAQFLEPLSLPQVIQPSGKRPSPENPAVQIPYYRVPMRAFEAAVHRDMKPTRMWGYAATSPGPTFETRSGEGLLVEWLNELPTTHLLPIDHTIHGAETDKPDVRAVVHLHGAKAPAKSDGYPEDWYVPGKSALSYYPNRQDAAMLWYHDHTLGINRLNVFAGLFGAYIVRDEFEDALNLPKGKYEIPLALCDRVFDLEGQLNYPISDKEKSPWVPEVFGDGILVNGKLFPYLEVEPRKYRFRVLNGANGRFFHLSLSDQTTSASMFKGQTFHQIGTDQGLLPAPVPVKLLTIAPGERADLIVEFAGSAGTNLFLKNDILPFMQFRIAAKGARDDSAMPAALRPVPKTPETAAVKTRNLTLVEIQDLVQHPVHMLLNNAHWSAPVTENPALDSVEIWNLINTTDDAHPIHLHLVKFQILDRRAFSIADYWTKNELVYRAPAMPPEPGEAGWKDTVIAPRAMVTRIIVKFEGFKGRYVWHCHVLEHEDNEMMRPFDVV